MSLADEMRNTSSNALKNNEEFNKIYQDFIEKIREKSNSGEREISWYDNDVYYNFGNPNRAKYLEMLKNKLTDEGFKFVYGYQIGKPLCNSQSQYIIW